MRLWLVALAGTLVWTQFGCADPDGDDGVEPVVWVSTAGPDHCGTITEDEVWAADRNPHIISCDVFLEGGKLSIGPGTEVLLAADVGLYVSHDGGTASLDVQGSAAQPVIMRSETGTGPGLYAGIEVGPFAGEVSLRHMQLDSGGGFNTIGALRVERKDILVEHVRITNAEEYGLFLWDGAGLSEGSTGLVISGTEGYPVRVDPDRADTLPAADSDYTGNDNDSIYIHHSGAAERAIIGPRSWEDLGVPYYADTALELDGSAQSPAILTLGPGVTVLFQEQSGLALSPAGGASGLLSEGTAEQPVTLSSAGGIGRGAWPGVTIDDQADDDNISLTHTIIEHAGGFNSNACLTANEANVRVQDVTIRSCEGAGFYFWGDAGFIEGSSGLQVTDSERSGEIWAYRAHTVPEEGIALSGNDVDSLYATWGHNEAIAQEVSWGDIGVPYRLEDGLTLEGSSGNSGILNLTAGLVLEFGVDAYLTMSWGGGSSGLRAIGTAAEPIRFTSAYAQEPGAWSGIEIRDNASDSDTIFEHVIIEYGGGLNSVANLELSDASPTLSHVHIAHSEEWGVYVWSGATPAMSTVTFEGNTAGDVGML